MSSFILRAAGAIFATSTVCTSPLFATDAPPPATTTDVVVKDKVETEPAKLICRYTVNTGSRIARRNKVCATAAEWQKKADENSDEMRGMSNYDHRIHVDQTPPGPN